jgi:phospholipid/cholesterol/gamma-HCH transport system substrate-binding protein
MDVPRIKLMNRSKFDLAVGVFVALGMIGVAFMALRVGNLASFDSGAGYRLEARFDNIGGLKVRAPVKSAGVVVGRIEGIHLDRESYEAVVEMRIYPQYRFTNDTIASILTSGLLGEQYLSLEVGGDPSYLTDGQRIPKTQSAMVLEKLIGQFLYNKASESAGSSK